MRELHPGLWHWEAPHPQWRPTEPWSENVSSYAIDDGEQLLLFDPLAVPAPYNHANVDSDEVLFYVGGDFMSRRGAGIEQGSISLHPGGHAHGPQPGAHERSIGAEFFDELAVMVDTFRPLELGEGGIAGEDGGYAWTWSRRGPAR